MIYYPGDFSEFIMYQKGFIEKMLRLKGMGDEEDVDQSLIDEVGEYVEIHVNDLRKKMDEINDEYKKGYGRIKATAKKKPTKANELSVIE